MGILERYNAIADEKRVAAEATQQQMRDEARFNAYKAAISNGQSPVNLATQNYQDLDMIIGARDSAVADREIEMQKYGEDMFKLNKLATGQ